MNFLLFIIKSAFDDFLRNKMRTFLTSLGILIGVFSVVMLIALGLGLKKYISDQFEAIGKNTLFIAPGKLLQGGSFNAAASLANRFDDKDLNRLKRIRDIKGIAPISSKTVKIKGRKKTELTTVFFTSEIFADTAGFEVDKGRFIEKKDVEKRSKVLVAGPKIIEKLFSTKEEALGAKISIDNVSFKIVGILKGKGGGGFGGPDYDSYLYGPYTTGYIFNPDKKFVRFSIKVDEKITINEAKKKIENELLKRYEEEDFSIIEPTELLSVISNIFNIINIFLIDVASISLLVGGVGIMNIMYVTVTDKTKEIGIRRAIGARKSDILYQFVAESVALSLVGGILGLIFAFASVLIVNKFFPAYISFTSVFLAIGVSTIIGIVFGVLPAKKAADLEPVEAIRYE